MNRRRFLAALAAFAAAPIAPMLATAAWKPLAIADVVTPSIFAPYATKIAEDQIEFSAEDHICDSIAREWARRIETYELDFIKALEGALCP